MPARPFNAAFDERAEERDEQLLHQSALCEMRFSIAFTECKQKCNMLSAAARAHNDRAATQSGKWLPLSVPKVFPK